MTPELLQKFCSTDELRPNMMHPFNIESFTYATNGHIIIRVPVDARYANNKGIPGAKTVMPYGRATEEMLPIPELPEIEYEQCRYCKGVGIESECDECDGTGKVTCDYDHEHDCPECDGTGNLDPQTCDNCEGTGKCNKLQPIRIGAVPVACKLLHLIAELPNVKIEHKTKHDLTAVAFTFDGGEGFVMPMREA